MNVDEVKNDFEGKIVKQVIESVHSKSNTVTDDQQNDSVRNAQSDL